MKWHVYDFFNLADNQHWLSEGSEPRPEILNQLPSLIQEKFGRLKVNQWSAGDYLGGFLVQGRKACLFRIYNGGRDQHSRPDRWVVLAATSDLNDWKGIDVVEALESPVM